MVMIDCKHGPIVKLGIPSTFIFYQTAGVGLKLPKTLLANAYKKNMRNIVISGSSSLLFSPPLRIKTPALWSGLRYRMTSPERGGRRDRSYRMVPPLPFYWARNGGGVWKDHGRGHCGSSLRWPFSKSPRWAQSTLPVGPQWFVYGATDPRRSAALSPLAMGCLSPDAGKHGAHRTAAT